MLVGLMSDTHDRIPAIAELLKRMTERGVGMSREWGTSSSSRRTA